MNSNNKLSKPILQVTILENQDVINGNIWSIHETNFNLNTKLFIVIHLKTRAILSYILYETVLNEKIITELYQKLLNQSNYNNIIEVHSEMNPTFNSDKVKEFLQLSAKPKTKCLSQLRKGSEIWLHLNY